MTARPRSRRQRLRHVSEIAGSRARGPARLPRDAFRARRAPYRRSRPTRCTDEVGRAAREPRASTRLWTHQAAAIDALRDGRHRRARRPAPRRASRSATSSRSSTPSLRGQPDTALLVFPTKALAQDQLRSLRSWLVPGLKAVTYDGDTPTDDRAWARAQRQRRAHEPRDAPQGHPAVPPAVGDVPHAAALRRGRRAAHVARHLRQPRRARAAPAAARVRALRLAPDVLLRERDDRQPGRARERVVRAPGHADRRRRLTAVGTLRRVLATTAARRALRRACVGERRGRRDCSPRSCATATRRSRSPAAAAAPSSSRSTRAAISSSSEPRLAPRVAAYRAGYRADERRELEADLTSGKLVGVAATNALELGIDVGGLDAVVLNGFPGTLASLWQQAGRAGRTGRRSTAVLVAGDDQLDQWYVAHPDRAARAASPSRRSSTPTTRSCCTRRSRARPTSCRSSRPTSGGSATGSTTRCATLVLDDLLQPRGGKMYWAGPDRPAAGRRAPHRQRRSSTTSSTRRPSARSARSTTRACSPPRIRARCTCTRVGSTG